MPYTPPSRRGADGKGVNASQEAFKAIMSQSNDSSSSVNSRKFYLGSNDSSDDNLPESSSTEQPEPSINASNKKYPFLSNSNYHHPNGSNSNLRSITPIRTPSNPRVSLLSSSVPFSPLSSLPSSSARSTPEPPDVFKFTTESPQSYSYTLMSPNSLALRLNVLKRSLEILIERPELMSSMGNTSSIGATGHLSPPIYSQNARKGSAAMCMMDNLIRMDRKASTAALSTVLENTQKSRASSPLTPTTTSLSGYFNNDLLPTQNNNSNSSNSNKVKKSNYNASNNNEPLTLDRELIHDLKEIIKVLETGIYTGEMTKDNANKVVTLHNLSLSNARQISKTAALRINLLHALATPFMDTSAVSAASEPLQRSIAGIPMLNSSPSVLGLSSLSTKTPNISSSASNKQFHLASTGKNSAPKAIFTCDLESPWDLKNANDLACLMFGISKASLRGLTLMDLIAPRSRDLVLDRLWKHNELVFSGEIIAIKRNNQGIAWTSLWAKRKEDFMILIFEQVPCDSIDVVVEKSLVLEDNDVYSVKSYVENSGTLFRDGNKLSGLKLGDFLPSMNDEIENKPLNSELSRMPIGRKDSTLINRSRYFTLKIDNNLYLPSAVTSEPLDTENGSDSLIRINLHSLPYIAGSFVISSKDFKILSFNNAIAKNLFGSSGIKNKSIDSILPNFSNFLNHSISENPNLMHQEGIVLPEHYFRKLHAYKRGSTNDERELLFMNSTGIDGLHRDGTLIKVDVQLRVIENEICILWITYSRTSSISSIPGLSSNTSSSRSGNANSLSSQLSLTNLRIEEPANNENTIADDDDNDTISNDKVVGFGDDSNNENGTNDADAMPSQLRLFPEVENDLYSCGSSEGVSRSNSTRTESGRDHDAGNSGGFSPQMARSDSINKKKFDLDPSKLLGKKKDSTTSDSSLSTATKTPSFGSSTTTASSSSSATNSSINTTTIETISNSNKVGDFKLHNILSEQNLLRLENEEIRKIKSESKNYPHKVGAMRREKKFTNFNVLKNLGQGAYGKVVVAEWVGDPKYKVVVKAIFKERILVDTWVRDRSLGTIPSEIQIMNFINSDPHANIMRIVDFFEDEKCYYLETPQHGDPPAIDLFDLIEVKPDMNELECKYIYFQCCSAMAHLHRHGIVHRDIKDENIIVDKNYIVKLIDFGSAAYTKNGPFGVFVGTIDYAAPEVLNGKPYEGKPQDVWAMGVLLYTLVFKENPFCNVDEILDGGFKFPRYHHVSESCVDLINMMLIKDINARPTMDQVLKHNWLKGFE